jgi:phosphomannomutase/phosphoglucomutase
LLYSSKTRPLNAIMEISKNIFREYDVRGTVGENLTDESVGLIARGTAAYFRANGKSKAVVCRDNRLSSEGFRDIFIKELTGAGVDVLDIGLAPTPAFYFACREYAPDEAGVMITGSHNPPEFNGFKIVRGHGTIYGDEIRRIYDIIIAGDFVSGSGSASEREVLPDYRKALLERVKIERSVHIIADAGNGTAATVMPDILADAGCEAEGLFCEVDGNFPNHFPDPTLPENLADLQTRVAETGAEVGVAFDGDADRIGAVDEKGRIIWGDRLLALYARRVLAENPGGKVIFEVKCSQALIEEIERLGGVPIMWKTGHSLIEAKIAEEGAMLAGEMSGHIYFADRYFGFDDAIYSTLRLAELLSASDRSLGDMLDEMPQYYVTPELRVPCPDDVKFDVVEKIKMRFKDDFGYEVITVDGARILFGDGWGLVRASNTQPVLVLRFEAETEERLDEIRETVEGEVKALLE